MNSKWCAFLLTLMTLGTATLTNSVNAAEFKSYQIKAVYIFRIANFVRWNNEQQMENLSFCVIGDKQIEGVLKTIIKDKVIRGLNLQLVKAGKSNSCDIVYLSSDQNLTMLDNFDDHTLTISDKAGFAQKGGVIELKSAGKKIKPRISINNAHLDEYTIGSNLLRIAVMEDK
ncbi:YfiR family protein [Vibrio makurazakiensis]|uniref:YfiR family protein n=1 Tax=Vibrio makurazakiensis TaxID=2910250 RepID=UPI003D11BFC0